MNSSPNSIFSEPLSDHRYRYQAAPQSVAQDSHLLEPELHNFTHAHTALRQVINAHLQRLFHPAASPPAVSLLSTQDQLALLHRLLTGKQADLPGWGNTATVIIACSAALAVADTIIFKSILDHHEISPRAIQAAVTNVEDSRALLEALLPGYPAAASTAMPVNSSNPKTES